MRGWRLGAVTFKETMRMSLSWIGFLTRIPPPVPGSPVLSDLYCSSFRAASLVSYSYKVRRLKEMLEPELCSSRGILSPFREESGDEELSVLPRHTKVIVTGNNRTKSVLVGLQGVVKKAVGLGGWHWLVLKNGVEVKLQRNALSVLEHPTGNEVDEDHDFDSSSGSDIGEKDHDFSSSIEFHKLSKPRVRQTRPWVSSNLGKGANRGSYRDVQSIIHTPHLRVNLGRLGTNALRRYCRHFNLVNINSESSRNQLLTSVQRHFASQQKLSEVLVISEFINAAAAAAKKRRTVDTHIQ
ncbi:hypothetical protein LWI29_021514 [Acer saccharum]|uniref:Histone deacetylase complex subunit SAP30 Sin3 binding domain-containing protein n=2 Tax=Acer TaxID=4022 RepID=A0AA39RZ51_ACESA|nr:hypothetical protein LWI29_021514 [Acer saccharum]